MPIATRGALMGRITIAQLLREMVRSLISLHRKVDQLMTEQEQINADVQAIEAGVTALTDAAANIGAEIAALKQANPTLDLSGLDKAAADLGTAVTAVSVLQTPPAAPAPVPAV